MRCLPSPSVRKWSSKGVIIFKFCGSGGSAFRAANCGSELIYREAGCMISGDSGDGGEMPVRVMGIDPGTRVVGYGVVDLQGGDLRHVAHGAFDVRKGESYAGRLLEIYEGLREAISKYKPDVCVVEEIFYARSAKSAIKTGEGRGVALLAVAAAGVEAVEYAATKIKKSVTGTGGAHKSQVQKMVRLQLGLKAAPEPEDASDALACAICHCHRLRFETRRIR
jgi:crossover junction endodeoxyribonuclease RuvC